jgi:DNA-binding protein
MIQQHREVTNMTEDDVVYIGNKPVMNYVLAVVTQFNNGASEVTIKARGRAISRAVDVAEVSRHRFLPNVEVKDIRISTEKVDSERGESNVSAMEILLGI